MIDFYFWPTPNGYKIALFLEETRLPYRIKPVDIGKGDQFEPDYLKISPNNKMPAIVDRDPVDGGDLVSVFESGAILLYLAGKTGKFIPRDPRARMQAIEWLFWQVSGLGPMVGQNHHFLRYAPEKIPYAVERYLNETRRLYRVLDKRLHGRDFIAHEYSVADMACYPWIVPYAKDGMRIEDFPNLHRWFGAIAARPATQRAYALGKRWEHDKPMSDEERKILFG
ncbi:MAG: glutathione S-transferase N-terminal domain-containing protein [Rhodanobacteraceae bacterium]